jgi:hypothetical protein
MFVIITFLNENTVDYIPEEWLLGREECLYPPSNAGSAKKRSAQPTSNWRKYPIRVLGSAGKNCAVLDYLFKILTLQEYYYYMQSYIVTSVVHRHKRR